jgi:hypothetical protein
MSSSSILYRNIKLSHTIRFILVQQQINIHHYQYVLSWDNCNPCVLTEDDRCSQSIILFFCNIRISFFTFCTSQRTLSQKTIFCAFEVPHKEPRAFTLLRRIVVSGFGGLEVSCWPLVPKFAGSNLAEAVGFFGRKNPQHAFLRRGSKAVCPVSCFTACKRTQK